MENYSIKIHWEGNIDLECVNWEYTNNPDNIAQSIPQHLIDNTWEQFQSQHPKAYDGSLLRLLEIKDYGDIITLIVSDINFSEVITMFNRGLVRKEQFGQLGIAMIIYDQDKDHFLVGQRSLSSLYRPGYYALPGGMLEFEDIEENLKSACLRELIEEITMDMNYLSYKLCAIVDNYDALGVQAIVEIETDFVVNGSSLPANDEWEGNTIEWVPISNIKVFNNRNCLNDLQYFVNNH